MGKRIVGIMNTYKGSTKRFSDTTCFVMGVGHLLGEDSVIKVAEAEGFKLNNVRTEEEIGSVDLDCLDSAASATTYNYLLCGVWNILVIAIAVSALSQC